MMWERRITLVLAAALIGPTSLAMAGAAQAPGLEDGNGIVMMVHGHVEPSTRGLAPAPPAHEAVVTTPNEDDVVFHVIPYAVETEAPVLVDAATLEVAPTTTDAFEVEPEPATAADGDPVCEEETGLPGHEGPTEACLVFRVPSGQFTGVDAVDLVLTGEADGESFTEPYNVASHVLLHASFDGAPVTVAQADAAGGQATPFLVDAAVDPA